jgi:putative flippase GtrA
VVAKQFLRFLIVGVLNTAFGYGLFVAFLYLGVQYPVAMAVSYCFGILFNFKSTGSLVFKSRNNRLLFRFIACYVVVYVVNVVGVRALDVFGVAPYLGAAILLLPMAVLSFILNRIFVFNSELTVTRSFSMATWPSKTRSARRVRRKKQKSNRGRR